MHLIPEHGSRGKQRSGVALIVVLGFLSVLIIMGVSFAVMMRTERLASRSFADVVRAKQITQAGLARALSDIDAQLAGVPLFVYPEFTTPGYPDVLVSSGTNVNYTLDSALGARSFFPLAVWSTTNAYPNPAYTDIRDPQAPGQPTIGRYCYMVVNCSGLLDANYIGGSSRGTGTNAAQIQLNTALLPEITSYGTNELPARRASQWKRFESLPDMLAICRANNSANASLRLPGDIIAKDPSIYNIAANLNNASNLFTYSRFPQGWLTSANQIEAPLYIGGSVSDLLARETEIKAMLASYAPTIPNVQAFFDNWVDYVDADSIPANRNGTAAADPNTICTESTPLLNEVVVKNWYTASTDGSGNTIHTNSYQILFEIAYPFGGTNGNAYTLTYGAQYLGDPKPDPITAANVPIPGPWTYGTYLVVTSAVKTKVTTNGAVSLSAPRVQFGARILSSGIKIDEVGFAPASYITLPTPNAAGVSSSKAVVDPRINWNAELDAQWKVVNSTNSLGLVNPVSVTAYNAPGADGEPTCYVANRPIRNTGELGLLLIDQAKPWQTISLLNGTNFYPVLDWFTVFTNTVLRGMVSLNSPQQPVIQTVLSGVRAERFPGDSSGVLLTDADTQALANQIMAGGVYTNRSDIRKAAAGVTLGSFTPMQSEGILRNSMDLFYTRQQIFTIMVVGQYLDSFGNSLAERKLVAVVWRDPFPNAAGKHENFVRFFKWMDVNE